MQRIQYLFVIYLATHVPGFSGQAHGDVVQYEITLDATWSNATHPQAYPSSAHFSGLIGGTHNANVSFWQTDELASPGIKRMAETGSKTLAVFNDHEESIYSVAFSRDEIIN